MRFCIGPNINAPNFRCELILALLPATTLLPIVPPDENSSADSTPTKEEVIAATTMIVPEFFRSPLNPNITCEEIEKIDFTTVARLTQKQCQALLRYLDKRQPVAQHADPSHDSLPDHIARTEYVVSKLATSIMYPDEADLKARGLTRTQIRVDEPYSGKFIDQERGEHPCESTTVRVIKGDFNPFKQKPQNGYRYPEFSDYYKADMEPNVASMFVSQADKNFVIRETLNPATYPLAIPHDLNLWDIPMPSEGETRYKVALNSLQHPYDWVIMRKEPWELDQQELERVIHIAQTPCTQHRLRLTVASDLLGKFSRRLYSKNKNVEVPFMRSFNANLVRFLANADNAARFLRSDIVKARAREIRDEMIELEIKKFDRAEADKYRAFMERKREELAKASSAEAAANKAARDAAGRYEWYEVFYLVPFAIVRMMLRGH